MHPKKLRKERRTSVGSKMDKCIFCQIVSQKISSFEVYKNEDVTAFLDINPVTSGHTLIISRTRDERHFMGLC